MNQEEVAAFQPARLPYHEAIEERFGIDKSQWKALVEAVYPSAKTIDAIAMVLSYCRARKLDPFKKPVHIVPMRIKRDKRWIWVDTVWPGIAELRTTAFRTGQYAGCEETQFGPTIERAFKGEQSYDEDAPTTREITVRFPEWCQITVVRLLSGKECRFVGPKVYWLEAYARWGSTEVPNEMWAKRPFGQPEKCAEAGALRRAFPEEIGNDYSAEEMEGQRLIEDQSVLLPRAAPVAPPPPPRPVPERDKTAESAAEGDEARRYIEHNPEPQVATEWAGNARERQEMVAGISNQPRAAPPPSPRTSVPPMPKAISTDFETVLKQYNAEAKLASNGDDLEEIWNRIVDPAYDEFFPPDKEALNLIHRDYHFKLERSAS